MSDPTENDIIELEKDLIMKLLAFLFERQEEFKERFGDSTYFGSIAHVALLNAMGIQMYYTGIKPKQLDEYLEATSLDIKEAYASFHSFREESSKPKLELVK